jgi:hypothetical protein
MQSSSDTRWNPALLGPLGDEQDVITGPVHFFAGEERFYAAKKLKQREKLVSEISPHLERVLEADETVLCVFPVLHYPPFLQLLGFGWWWSLFFRAAVVLTDRRLVEVLMRDKNRAGTRVWSYSWAQVRKLKQRMGSLSLTPSKGRTQKWKLLEKGDRKLLKLLVPGLEEGLPEEVSVPRPVPLWHCPECSAASVKHPKVCTQCGTVFKTTGLAAGLALAFPGAGLVYAEHRVLALFDLLGEVFLFGLVAMFFLSAADAVEMAVAAVFGLFALFFTKLESAHLATVLVKRTKPDPNRKKWQQAAIATAVLSAALIAIPPMFTGVLANRLDRDLDFSANSQGWEGGFDGEQWQYGDEPNQRSEWINADGRALFVWSFPLAPAATFESFSQDLELSMGEASVEALSIPDFDGLRVIEMQADDEGNQLLWIRWVLFDREFDDVHMIGASSWPGEEGALEEKLSALLLASEWRPAANCASARSAARREDASRPLPDALPAGARYDNQRTGQP